MKNKKVLWIVLGAIDVAVVLFLFVIHILMLINVVGKTPEALHEFIREGNGLIGFLAGHLWVYGVFFVIPLFLILIGNVVWLVFYVRKTSKAEKVTVNDLSDEEKEALRKELLNDLAKPKEEAKEEVKEETK